jgi:hypothetical protein
VKCVRESYDGVPTLLRRQIFELAGANAAQMLTNNITSRPRVGTRARSARR